jgi:hypothetical protein
MNDWRIVPDNLREREPIRRGRAPKNKLSRALLNGQTIFIQGENKTFGSLYTLAKNHNKRCVTQRTEINNERGTLIWFEDLEPEVWEHPRLGTMELKKGLSQEELDRLYNGD